MKAGDTVFYVEEINGELFDRPAVVLGDATRCAVCNEPEEGHARPSRRHAFQGVAGLALRVTFPTGRRRGLPEEVAEYPFVAEGSGPNQWHA